MPSKDLHDKEIAYEFYEDRYEHGYMEEWDQSKKEKVAETIKKLGLPSKGKLLDYGCGNGVFTRILKNLLPGWDVFGVEISQIAVQNAKQKNPDCTFFHADQAAEYAKEFDFLFSHHVIEHVQDLTSTFLEINQYLKDNSSQLHILPCGNQGSYEYNIAILHKNGIQADIENRFFYEEAGHLRRLTSQQFQTFENKIGFSLAGEWYSNQKDGALTWITKSSPRFVKKLTDPSDAVDEKAASSLKKLRSELLPKTYRQFAYAKFWEIKSKWKKGLKDRILLVILYVPAMLSKPYYLSMQKKADEEWAQRNHEKNGSEMFLYFKRPL